MSPERLVGLYNIEMASSETLRTAINRLSKTRVVTELSEPEDLKDALRRRSVNLLVMHLDPDPKGMLPIVEYVAAHFPDVPMVAVSNETNPHLIITAMRAGCQQFVCEPLDAGDLAQAVDRVTVHHAPAGGNGRRICVIGGSGGVGATTIVCNLAMELAHLTNHEAAVMDLQLEFGDVASNFDCAPPHTIANLCDTEADVDATMLEKAVVPLPCQVAVLGRPNTVEEAGLVTADRVTSIVRVLSDVYRNVVIDTPRTFDRVTLSALEQADAVLIVLQLVVPSIRNATRLHQTLLSYGMPEDRVHIVVNRYRKNIGRITPEDVQKHFKQEIFAILPNDYQCVTNSLDFGHPLSADSPDSPVRSAIREMAQHLMGNEPETVDASASPKKTRLFGRIFG